jgi:hypothetical protein
MSTDTPKVVTKLDIFSEWAKLSFKKTRARSCYQNLYKKSCKKLQDHFILHKLSISHHSAGPGL